MARTFDPDAIEKIMVLIDGGRLPIIACPLGGIPKATFFSWMLKGDAYRKAVESGKEGNPDHEKYAFMRERFILAKARFVDATLTKHDDAATKTNDTKALQWRLRTFAPHIFGDRDEDNPLNKKIADRDRIKEAQKSITTDTRGKLAELGEEIADQMAGDP